MEPLLDSSESEGCAYGAAGGASMALEEGVREEAAGEGGCTNCSCVRGSDTFRDCGRRAGAAADDEHAKTTIIQMSDH